MGSSSTYWDNGFAAQESVRATHKWSQNVLSVAIFTMRATECPACFLSLC